MEPTRPDEPTWPDEPTPPDDLTARDEPTASEGPAAPSPEGVSGTESLPHAPQDTSTEEERPPRRPTVRRAGGGAGRRLLAAAVLAPWIIGYGVTGSWAVARGARGLAQHVPHIDAGYTHAVSAGALIAVGALVLAAFAVLLATAILLLVSAGRGTWTTVLAVALALLAGAVWAGFAGHIDIGSWLVLFFGLLFCAALDALMLWRTSRGSRHATIVEP